MDLDEDLEEEVKQPVEMTHVQSENKKSESDVPLRKVKSDQPKHKEAIHDEPEVGDLKKDNSDPSNVDEVD